MLVPHVALYCIVARQQPHSTDSATEILLLCKNSVADPFQFDTAPDPRIRYVEKRMRPKMEKI